MTGRTERDGFPARRSNGGSCRGSPSGCPPPVSLLRLATGFRIALLVATLWLAIDSMGTTPVTVGAANVNPSTLSSDVTVYVHQVNPGATLGLTRAVDLLGTPLSDVRGMRASSLA